VLAGLTVGVPTLGLTLLPITFNAATGQAVFAAIGLCGAIGAVSMVTPVAFGAVTGFVLMAVIVAKTSAVADLLRTDGTGPVGIGILAPALNSTMIIWSQRDQGALGRSSLSTSIYAVMLIAAGLLLGGLASRRGDHRGSAEVEPARSDVG
jgi:hypothetical protein